MKKYERALRSMRSLAGWALLAGAIGGFIFGLVTLANSVGDDNQAAADEIAWCLDNGGRRVAIDGWYDCFQLTIVEDSLITNGLFGGNKMSQCKKRSDAVWIKVQGGDKNCFHFERLVKEKSNESI